jgi:pSer/pThr/pTyr-binding forkhead associated (FHA) protein
MNQLSQYLEIIHPDGMEQIVNLQNAAIKIGRAAGNDIVLSDDKVSQWHCIITPSEEGYWGIRDGIIDRGSYRCSTNGTFLKRNNQIIDIRSSSDCKEFLSGDDEIQIQGWRIIFRDPFKTNRGKSTNPVQDNNTDGNSIQNGHVFCLSQKTLYLIEGKSRKEVPQPRAMVVKFLTYLTIQNISNQKPSLCSYGDISKFIWGDTYHGADEIQGLARELRKIIGDKALETRKTEGYILKIGYEE